MPNIQELELGKLQGTLALETPLFAFEKLDINADISAKNLQSLLQKMPNIQELKLGELSDKLQLTTDLLSLKYFSISGKYITTKSLEALLQKTPNIERLSLDYCRALSGDLTLKKPLSALKYFSASSSAISIQNIQEILTGASRVSEIILAKCTALNGTDLRLAEPLSALEYLNISGSNISAVNLEKLLKGTPNSIKIANSIISQNKQYGTDNSKSMDANTLCEENKVFELCRFFYPIDNNRGMPAPPDYRLEIFDTLEINKAICNPRDAFKINNKSDRQLSKCNILPFDVDLFFHGKKLQDNSTKDNTIYYGKKTFELSENWQAIPSLFAHETMTHYHIDPTSSQIEIQYSQRDNLYYIRGHSGQQKVDLDFLIQVPSQQKTNKLPQDIQKKIEEFLAFGSGELENKGNLTGQGYLDCIQKQKKGACRHRAIAFKSWMSKENPSIPTRIVTNDCHAFAEILIENQWIPCDLGGYPAALKIQEMKSTHEVNEEVYSPNTNDNMLSLITQQMHNYAQYLRTWDTEKSKETSVNSYCLDLMKSRGKNRLITLESTEAVTAMHSALQEYCKAVNRPAYYIHSPDDLVCSAHIVTRDENNQGRITCGPGGSLYDFLQKKGDLVLIVNYEQFSADNIVRFNGLLDKVRHADGTHLPENTLVIGVINTKKPDCYQGADFYSRFDSVEACPLTTTVLEKHIKHFPIIQNELSTVDAAVINFYHGLDWKERLLGQWTIQREKLYFQEGELEAALNTNKPLHIINGLWELPEFRHFWQQAFLLGQIEHQGHVIVLPKDFHLIQSEGYDWDLLKKGVTWNMGFCHEKDAFVLNQGHLNQFFNLYEITDTQTLRTLPGLIGNRSSEQVLHVNLTSTLSEDEWAKLLANCQYHKVSLTVHYASSAHLPSALKLNGLQNSASLPRLWDETTETTNTYIIKSTDIDTTVAMLTSDTKKPWLVLEISECNTADLLIKINAKFNEKQMCFEFTQQEQVLLQALRKQQNVILKGYFSEELANGLSVLLLERQVNQSLPGRLVLISDDTSHFDYLLIHEHTVHPSMKQLCLTQHDFSDKEIQVLDSHQFEQESLSRLEARLYHKRRYPLSSTTDDAWQGVEGLASKIRLDELDIQNSHKKSSEFTQKRLDAVNKVLENAPYVFLAGVTGVGKSTFVEKHLSQGGSKLYHGETKLKAWAADSTNNRKILFVDEANLSKRQWSELEGLFHTPQGILIEGQYYPLDINHKVVFAGNPLNYGDERKPFPFILRHGNTVVFDPLPSEMIYEEILKPIFTKSTFQDNLSVYLTILDTYRFLCEKSRDSIIISPRELQMMALLTVSYCQQHPNEEAPLFVAQHYTYQLARALVPEKHLPEYERRFKPETDWIRISLPQKIKEAKKTSTLDFLITPSRKQIHEQLTDLLDLRTFRRSNSDNDAQRYGGLGGIVIDGEPGIGKSELVLSVLRANGYEEQDDFHATNMTDNIFYRMPVSMQISDKEALLRKAFDEGHVVVVDEINSSPMMERLLNDLLMGKTPEGTRPKRPGFLLIGTQNPVTFAGRRVASPALLRRLIPACLLPYPKDEMIDLLINHGLSQDQASGLVQIYITEQEFAIKNHLTPAPTFRNLFRVTDFIVGETLSKEINKILSDETKSEMWPALKVLCEHNIHNKTITRQAITNELMRKWIVFCQKNNLVNENHLTRLAQQIEIDPEKIDEIFEYLIQNESKEKIQGILKAGDKSKIWSTLKKLNQHNVTASVIVSPDLQSTVVDVGSNAITDKMMKLEGLGPGSLAGDLNLSLERDSQTQEIQKIKKIEERAQDTLGNVYDTIAIIPLLLQNEIKDDQTDFRQAINALENKASVIVLPDQDELQPIDQAAKGVGDGSHATTGATMTEAENEIGSSAKATVTNIQAKDINSDLVQKQIDIAKQSEVERDLLDEEKKIKQLNQTINYDYALKEQCKKFEQFLYELMVIHAHLAKKYNPEEPIVIQVAKLKETLNIAGDYFFKKPLADNFSQFQETCTSAFKSVELEARNHRGWFLVSPILRGILGVLAALAVIPALIVNYKSNHGFIQTFFAKPETDTSKKVDLLKNEFMDILNTAILG